MLTIRQYVQWVVLEFSTGDQLEYIKHTPQPGHPIQCLFYGNYTEKSNSRTMPIFITKSRRLYRKFQTMKNVIYKN